MGVISIGTCVDLAAEFGPPKTFARDVAGGVWSRDRGSAVVYVRQAQADHHRGDRELMHLLAQVSARGLQARAIIVASGSGLRSISEARDLQCLLEVCADPTVSQLFTRHLDRLGRDVLITSQMLNQLLRSGLQEIAVEGGSYTPSELAAISGMFSETREGRAERLERIGRAWKQAAPPTGLWPSHQPRRGTPTDPLGPFRKP